MYNLTDSTVGEFVEVTYGKGFSYSKTTDAWALSKGFTHEVDVLDGKRYARVLKTVAHILTHYNDETEECVTEAWKIKQHRVYTRNTIDTNEAA